MGMYLPNSRPTSSPITAPTSARGEGGGLLPYHPRERRERPGHFSVVPLFYLYGNELGAADGTRTHDIQLGKLTLYQLSYSRSQS